MTRYRKKPVVIDAIQWTGGNFDDLDAWLDQWHAEDDDAAAMWQEGDALVIPTLEGDMTASAGDWIIRGVQNEFYPCKDSIFRATYEPVDE